MTRTTLTKTVTGLLGGVALAATLSACGSPNLDGTYFDGGDHQMIIIDGKDVATGRAVVDCEKQTFDLGDDPSYNTFGTLNDDNTVIITEDSDTIPVSFSESADTVMWGNDEGSTGVKFSKKDIEQHIASECEGS